MPHHNSNIVKHRYGSEGYEGENLAATAIMLAGVYTPMLKLMRELLRRKGMTPSLEQWFRWFRWCLKKVTTHANKVSKSLFTFCWYNCNRLQFLYKLQTRCPSLNKYDFQTRWNAHSSLQIPPYTWADLSSLRSSFLYLDLSIEFLLLNRGRLIENIVGMIEINSYLFFCLYRRNLFGTRRRQSLYETSGAS